MKKVIDLKGCNGKIAYDMVKAIRESTKVCIMVLAIHGVGPVPNQRYVTMNQGRTFSISFRCALRIRSTSGSL